MKKLGLLSAFIAVLLLAGCGQLVKPESLEQRIAYGNGVVTAVANAAAVSLDNHQITLDEAKAVREMAQQASVFLDAAEQAQTEAEGKDSLALATAVLTQLQAFLASRGG